jgi:hypothetical protein
MDSNRIISIIMSELSLDNLKLQESLEKTINSTEEINQKISSVKDLLAKLALNDAMITKFQSLVSPNNNKLNTNENG